MVAKLENDKTKSNENCKSKRNQAQKQERLQWKHTCKIKTVTVNQNETKHTHTKNNRKQIIKPKPPSHTKHGNKQNSTKTNKEKYLGTNNT